MNSQEYRLEDTKHALIAFDPEQKKEVKDILHFCAYLEQPTYSDMVSLKQELMTNPEFGLIHIGENLEILLAPEDLVQNFVKEVSRMGYTK